MNQECNFLTLYHVAKHSKINGDSLCLKNQFYYILINIIY